MAIEKLASISSLLKRFTIYEVSGEVLESAAGVHQEVKGKIYGGGTAAVHGGTAVNSSVQGKIETETTHHQTIYLKSDDGIETVVDTVHMTVPIRDSHRLTLWRIGNDKWIKAYNHSTDQWYERTDMNKVLFPVFIYFLIGIIFPTLVMSDAGTSGMEYGIFWFMYFLLGLALALIPIAFIWRWRNRAIDKAIRKNSLALTARAS